MQIERLCFTTYYACGHQAIRMVRKDDVLTLSFTNKNTREWHVGAYCNLCRSAKEREYERRREVAAREAEQRAAIRLEQHAAQKHYLIDGQLYTVIQDRQGFWRGRRRENGHTIQKHFGKTDPRPMLQEVELSGTP